MVSGAASGGCGDGVGGGGGGWGGGSGVGWGGGATGGIEVGADIGWIGTDSGGGMVTVTLFGMLATAEPLVPLPVTVKVTE